MAASNGQRVAAFLLALTFLLSTIGFTAFVVLSINGEDDIIVPEQSTSDTDTAQAADAQTPPETDPEATVQPDKLSGACGSQTIASIGERTIPETVTADVPVSELQKIDVKEGDGPEVQPGDCVAALYYGTLATDGSRFDGNYDSGTPIEFPLTGVIAGWTEGIPGMKVGGVRRLIIPAAQAYGATERPGIPADSDLIFEVEIVSTRQAE